MMETLTVYPPAAPEERLNKILLILMPYWTPSIPPLGISSLKGHLTSHGFDVVTIDANMEPFFRECYDQYFDIVQRVVAGFKRGNFFNIGMDVMRNHMMAFMNKKETHRYTALINAVFYQTFYTHIDEEGIQQLDKVLEKFYGSLDLFVDRVLTTHTPDVLGLSVFSGNLPASVYTFRLAKRLRPGLVTVMGGGTFSMELAEGSPNYEYFLGLTEDYIDKFFIGEGEQLFLQFLQGRLNRSQRVYTTRDIGKSNVDVNKAELPDFSDFNLLAYPQLGGWSSRSCPFQCSFCSETIHWGVYRKKTPARIADELLYQFQKYGTQIFMMGDSLLNIIATGLAEEFLQRPTILYWDGYMRADPPVCEPANALLWRRGGMYRARLGVESGSQKVLDIMHKKITVDQIRRSVKSLSAAGIKTTTYWIVGHPGETEEDFQMTLDLIAELKNDLWEAECNPFSYYLTGQVDSDKWMSEYKRVTLYPEDMQDMLITQTWIMEDCEPVRPVIYERVNRFVNHCRELGIPNPYFEYEIYEADERWKRLHKNAVPALVDFKDRLQAFDESRHVKLLDTSMNVSFQEGEFHF